MKKGQIQKGFKPYRNMVQQKQGTLRRLRSCTTCKYFYGDRGEEECHNNNVTSYDITKGEDCTYCTFWKPIGM